MVLLGRWPEESPLSQGTPRPITPVWQRWFSQLAAAVNNLSGITSGTGSPEGVVTGSVGDIYRRRDGGALTSVWFKETGNDTNTGWVAK